ncbi:MAG: hypothetical protein AAFV37_00145 [Pseudomonadota bacterium]
MTDLTVLSAPNAPAVSLDLVKDYLGVGHDGEDRLIGDLLQSAVSRVTQVAEIALVRQTFEQRWLTWPAELAGRGARLARRPVRSLLSVGIERDDGTLEDHSERFTLASGRVRLRPWSMLPPIASPARARLVFEAGYDDADSVPADLREAVLRLVASMYQARPLVPNDAGLDVSLPADVQAILNAHDEVRL